MGFERAELASSKVKLAQRQDRTIGQAAPF